jgi:hypothetical protein
MENILNDINLDGPGGTARANVNGRLGDVSWKPWDERSKNLKRWSTFPAVTTLAAYLTNEQVINICSFPASVFDCAFAESASWGDKLPVLPLLSHEIRHWMDHLGTLWGQQMVVSAFNAMNARDLNNPDDFSYIVDHWQAERRDHFEDFYTVIGKPNPTTIHRWIAMPTCGHRFDSRGKLRQDKPLLLVNFAWPDGTHACRAPLSVLALLEAGAMHYEQSARAAILSVMPAGELAVEEARNREEVTDFLYNPSLSAYTAAAHLVANAFHINDASIAFKTTSRLAALCLNLPGTEISRMRAAELFASHRRQMQHLRNAQDRGFAFLNLLHADDSNVEDQEWLKVRVQKTLARSLDELEARVRAEMLRLPNTLKPGPHRDRALKLLITGREVFDNVGLFHQKSDGENTLLPSNPPAVIFPDETLRTAAGKTLDGLEETEQITWVHESFRLQNQMEEFVRVCGV